MKNYHFSAAFIQTWAPFEASIAIGLNPKALPLEELCSKWKYAKNRAEGPVSGTLQWSLHPQRFVAQKLVRDDERSKPKNDDHTLKHTHCNPARSQELKVKPLVGPTFVKSQDQLKEAVRE